MITEETMTFNETVAERNELKKSAKCKKNGSNTSKLGNRRLTNKEIAEKHGECEKYDLNSFMTFEEFKAMPDDLQVEYINKLQDQYNVGISKINDIVFEQPEAGALHKHLSEKDLFLKCIKSRKVPLNNDGEEDLIADVAAYRATQKAEEEASKIDPKFITIDKFEAMNDLEKKQYINAIIRKFDVGIEQVSMVLFKRSHGYLNWKAKKGGFAKDILRVSSKNKLIQKENNAAFKKAVEKWEKETITIGKEPEMTTVTAPAVESIKINDIDYAGDTEDTTVYAIIVKEDPPKVEPELPELTQEPANMEEDPRVYHDSSYISSYVSIGLNEDEFNALALLFKNKKVRVKLEITEVAGG